MRDGGESILEKDSVFLTRTNGGDINIDVPGIKPGCLTGKNEARRGVLKSVKMREKI